MTAHAARTRAHDVNNSIELKQNRREIKRLEVSTQETRCKNRDTAVG